MKLTTVQVGETNCYFVQNAGGVILLDAGPVGAEKKLIPVQRRRPASGQRWSN